MLETFRNPTEARGEAGAHLSSGPSEGASLINTFSWFFQHHGTKHFFFCLNHLVCEFPYGHSNKPIRSSRWLLAKETPENQVCPILSGHLQHMAPKMAALVCRKTVEGKNTEEHKRMDHLGRYYPPFHSQSIG